MSKATNRVCEKPLIQNYTHRCCGCGKEGREICRQKGEMVTMIISGLVLLVRGFCWCWRSQTTCSLSMGLWGQNKKP